MPIPQYHQGRCVYHFTHIDNLPGLIESGFLSNNHPQFPQNGHRSVAASGIQERRAAMAVPCGPGGFVHDYVPSYFGSVSPMLLAVINAKNVDQMDILYFEFPIDIINQPGSVFTDASANTKHPPNFYSNPSDLDKLNWALIDSKKWGEREDENRHSRMAELLVHGQLPLTAALRCVVWNEDARKRVSEIVAATNTFFPPIEFESQQRRHWYTDFANKSLASIVTGPREIANTFQMACEYVHTNGGTNVGTAPFANLTELLKALRVDFGCIPQTAELVGLKSANGIHKRTVDTHTKEVVDRLLTLNEYHELEPKFQSIVEIAAYLHDIGKGPRSRWDSNGGLQKVDPNHPVGAMPMMAEILTEQVASVSRRGARRLLKLVCYHDLVGDILGRGRDVQQLVDIVEDESDLMMLFALGRADASVLVETWWREDDAHQLYSHCKQLI